MLLILPLISTNTTTPVVTTTTHTYTHIHTFRGPVCRGPKMQTSAGDQNQCKQFIQTKGLDQIPEEL